MNCSTVLFASYNVFLTYKSPRPTSSNATFSFFWIWYLQSHSTQRHLAAEFVNAYEFWWSVITIERGSKTGERTHALNDVLVGLRVNHGAVFCPSVKAKVPWYAWYDFNGEIPTNRRMIRCATLHFVQLHALTNRSKNATIVGGSTKSLLNQKCLLYTLKTFIPVAFSCAGDECMADKLIFVAQQWRLINQKTCAHSILTRWWRHHVQSCFRPLFESRGQDYVLVLLLFL